MVHEFQITIDNIIDAVCSREVTKTDARIGIRDAFIQWLRDQDSLYASSIATALENEMRKEQE